MSGCSARGEWSLDLEGERMGQTVERMVWAGPDVLSISMGSGVGKLGVGKFVWNFGFF